MDHLVSVRAVKEREREDEREDKGEKRKEKKKKKEKETCKKRDTHNTTCTHKHTTMSSSREK